MGVPGRGVIWKLGDCQTRVSLYFLKLKLNFFCKISGEPLYLVVDILLKFSFFETKIFKSKFKNFPILDFLDTYQQTNMLCTTRPKKILKWIFVGQLWLRWEQNRCLSNKGFPILLAQNFNILYLFKLDFVFNFVLFCTYFVFLNQSSLMINISFILLEWVASLKSYLQGTKWSSF